MTWRRFAVLLSGLPAESRFARAVHGEVVTWGPTEHLLATLIDLCGNRWAGRKWRPLKRPVSKTASQPVGLDAKTVEARMEALRRRDQRRRVRSDR